MKKLILLLFLFLFNCGDHSSKTIKVQLTYYNGDIENVTYKTESPLERLSLNGGDFGFPQDGTYVVKASGVRTFKIIESYKN